MPDIMIVDRDNAPVSAPPGLDRTDELRRALPAGFRSGTIDVRQIVFVRQRWQ